MYICCALLKYGYPKFSLEILEYCKVEDLLIREKHYLYLLKPEYNISLDPTVPFSLVNIPIKLGKKMSWRSHMRQKKKQTKKQSL
jgi:hypothetical protein